MIIRGAAVTGVQRRCYEHAIGVGAARERQRVVGIEGERRVVRLLVGEAVEALDLGPAVGAVLPGHRRAPLELRDLRGLRERGSGAEETGCCTKTGKVLVALDPAYRRPTEVDLLLGDPAKAITKPSATARRRRVIAGPLRAGPSGQAGRRPGRSRAG